MQRNTSVCGDIIAIRKSGLYNQENKFPISLTDFKKINPNTKPFH